MGLFGRLLGKGKVLIGAKPPVVPAGGRAWAALNTDAMGATSWCVRVQMPGEEMTPACKQLGPTFKHQTSAYAYLDWINGGPPFQYPPGEA